MNKISYNDLCESRKEKESKLISLKAELGDIKDEIDFITKRIIELVDCTSGLGERVKIDLQNKLEEKTKKLNSIVNDIGALKKEIQALDSEISCRISDCTKEDAKLLIRDAVNKFLKYVSDNDLRLGRSTNMCTFHLIIKDGLPGCFFVIGILGTSINISFDLDDFDRVKLYDGETHMNESFIERVVRWILKDSIKSAFENHPDFYVVFDKEEKYWEFKLLLK